MPKFLIKAKDYCLHLTNVAVSGFLNPGPAPEGVQKVDLPLQYTAEEATSSQLAIKEEEEEAIVEVSNSKDKFEVFNQPQSLEVPIGDLNHIPPAQVSHSQADSTILDTMV